MNSRRILLLEDPSWGGVQTMSRTLADGLTSQGWHVTALPWRQTAWGTLVQAAKQHDIIVGTHNFGPTYAGAALKAITGKPLVSWVHGPLQDVLHTARASTLKKIWLKLLYKQVDHFVCVSRTTEDALMGFANKLARQQTCHVVPNGLGPLNSGPPLPLTTASIGAPPSLMLGYVGRVSPEKQPDLLLATLRYLPPHVQLGVVGDGPALLGLVDNGMDLLEQGRLHILGRHTHSASLYQPWHMTLLTSRYEGCPMTALESLASGVPCVALPIPAMQELFSRDAPYLLARDQSPAALADAVMALQARPATSVQHDMARIVARHSLHDFLQNWQQVLLSC